MKKLFNYFMAILLCFGLVACGSSKYEDSFTDYECIYFPLNDLPNNKYYDLIIIRYSIVNDTEKNWEDENFGVSENSNVLKINKNEYKWYIPESWSDPGYNYINAHDGSHPKDIKEVMSGTSRNVTVCFAVGPNEFNENFVATLNINFNGKKIKKDITYDMFTVYDD